jgi:RHS repeat-associated protein
MSAITQTTARAGQSASADQSFTYADDGRLIKSVSADGVVTIWCYYSAKGGNGPNLDAYADGKWFAELPLLSAPAIDAGLPLLLQAQYQYMVLEGVVRAQNLTVYGYPAHPQGRSSRVTANVVVTLEGVVVSNAEEAMADTSKVLTLKREAGRHLVLLHCQRTAETPDSTTVTESRYWGAEKVELVTTESRTVNLNSGMTVRLSSRAADGSNSDVALSSELRSLYSGRVRRKEQGSEQTRLEYDSQGRVLRETTYANDTAQNEKAVRTDRQLSDLETRYKDTQNGTLVTHANLMAQGSPRHVTLYDGLQRAVRVEVQRTSGSDISAQNLCPIQSNGQALDYLPGGLQRPLDESEASASARDWFWVGSTEKEEAAPSNATSLFRTVQTEGDIRGIRLIREQTHTNLKNGGAVQNLSERVPASAGSARSRVQIEKTFDAAGRLTQVKRSAADSSGSEQHYGIGYDQLSRATTFTDTDGTVVTRTYAGMTNNVIKLSLKGPDGKEITLGSQVLEQQSRLTQRQVGNRIYQFDYSDGSVTGLKMPDQSRVFSEMSADGNTCTWKAQSTGADGRVRTTELVSFKIDLLQQAITAVRPAAPEQQQTEMRFQGGDSSSLRGSRYSRVTSSLTLNANLYCSLLGTEHVAEHANGNQVATYRDRFNRRTRVRRNHLEYYYRYDAWGTCVQKTVRNLRTGHVLTVSHELDAFGQESVRRYRINGREVEVYRQEWSGNGQLLSKALTREGVVCRNERFSYDSRDRLKSWEVDAVTTDGARDASGKALRGQSYEYDLLNNLKSCDTLYIDGSRRRQEYSYATANPTQRSKVITIQTPAQGGVPTRSETDLVYNNNGNLTRDEQGRTLSYTLTGQLQSVSRKDGVKLTRYEYDERGRLTVQWDEQTKQRRVLVYSGDVQSGEIWLNADSTEQQHLRLDEEAGLAVQRITAQGLQTVFTLTDPQSGLSSEYSVDGAANLKHQSICFTPWGESAEDAWSGLISIQGYNNARRDWLTGCYHLGNGYRVYDPNARVFQQPDSESPFGMGGLNDCAYCSGDPVNLYDPDGHVMISRWGEAQMMGNLDQLIRDLTPQKPPEQDNRGSLWTTIIWSALAIAVAFSAVLLAIPSGGLSLVAAGVLFAATVVSSGLSIASVALQNSNPALADKLGAAAMIVDVASLIIPIKAAISGGIRMLRWMGTKAGQITRRVGATLQRVAGKAGGWGGKGISTRSGMVELGGTMEELAHVEGQIFMFEDTYNLGRRLNIQGHGTRVADGSIEILVTVGPMPTTTGAPSTSYFGTGTQRVTWKPQELYAELINRGIDFYQYDSVRLLMCRGAEGGSRSFAATLTRLTGRPVKGYVLPVTANNSPGRTVRASPGSAMYEPGTNEVMFKHAKDNGLVVRNFTNGKMYSTVAKAPYMDAGTGAMTTPTYTPEWFPFRPVKHPNPNKPAQPNWSGWVANFFAPIVP